MTSDGSRIREGSEAKCVRNVNPAKGRPDHPITMKNINQMFKIRSVLSSHHSFQILKRSSLNLFI